jgi:hypothetical protein
MSSQSVAHSKSIAAVGLELERLTTEAIGKHLVEVADMG